MKNTLLAFFLLFMTVQLHAQAGGMRVYTGITSMTNKDKLVNPDGHAHSGYHIGVDGRIMSGGMSFLVGGRYTSVSRLATDDFQISGHDSNLSLINGRVGLDISVFTLGPIARLRTKALASFDVVLTETGSELPPPGFRLNDGWFGIVTGLGADIGPAVIDIEYEFGLLNAYYKKKESTFNSITVSVGFFF